MVWLNRLSELRRLLDKLVAQELGIIEEAFGIRARRRRLLAGRKHELQRLKAVGCAKARKRRLVAKGGRLAVLSDSEAEGIAIAVETNAAERLPRT